MTNTHEHKNSPRPPARDLDRSGGANQSDAAGTDINTIVAQYMKHGTLPNVSARNPLYGDFTPPEDIHSMREICEHAQDRFDELPSAIRSYAKNDYAIFIDMFDDPLHQAEMIKLGLNVENLPTPLTPTNTPSPEPTTTTSQTPETTPTTTTPPETAT